MSYKQSFYQRQFNGYPYNHVAQPSNTYQKYYGGYHYIGDEEGKKQMPQEDEGKPLVSAGIIAAVVFGLIFIAALVLTAVFSGIAAFRDVSTECNATSPLSGDNNNNINYDMENSLNEIINSLTTVGTCKSLCANGCFNKFYSCRSDNNPDECERRSLILKDCNNFNNCLGECGLAFDHCITAMEDSKEFSGYCVNKYNREIICPKG